MIDNFDEIFFESLCKYVGDLEARIQSLERWVFESEEEHDHDKGSFNPWVPPKYKMDEETGAMVLVEKDI